MTRAAETQNEIIERWKAELSSITNLGYHPEPDGSQRECIHLDNVLVRLSLIVGEAFTMGTAYGMEIAPPPLYIMSADDLPDDAPHLRQVVQQERRFARKPATGGRVSSIPLAGERQGCGERSAAEKIRASGQRLIESLGNPELTTADYVEIGEHRIPLIADPNVPEGTVAVGSCSCGHFAIGHDEDGCQVVIRLAHEATRCPCSTPVSRLASKATGTGEQP